MSREEQKREQSRYEDIIGLPHHVSLHHPQMSMVQRAAQFLPFAALTGYGDVIQETARYTGERLEFDENERALLDQKLGLLAMRGRGQRILVTYFQPDKKKEGGSYVTAEGRLKKIDEVSGGLVLEDGREIPAADILDFSFADEGDGAAENSG